MRKDKISNNVIRRLPRYLRQLNNLYDSGIKRVSSAELGRQLGVTPSQVRQDLSTFGEFGLQGYGYTVDSLRQEIEIIMGTNRDNKAILVGCGSLGKSLIQNFSFEEQGITLIAAFDLCKDLIDTKINGVPIYDARSLPEYLSRQSVDLAVMTVPRNEARGMTSLLIENGIQAFWNFTNEELVSPDSDVLVENVHFSDSLLSLSFHMAERADLKYSIQRVAAGS